MSRINWTEDDRRKLQQFRFALMNELDRIEDPVYFYEHYCDQNGPRKNPAGGIEFFRQCRVVLTKFSKGHFKIIK